MWLENEDIKNYEFEDEPWINPGTEAHLWDAEPYEQTEGKDKEKEGKWDTDEEWEKDEEWDKDEDYSGKKSGKSNDPSNMQSKNQYDY